MKKSGFRGGLLSICLLLSAAQGHAVHQWDRPTGKGGVEQVLPIEAVMRKTQRRPLLAHVRFCHFYAEECEKREDRRDLHVTLEQKMAELVEVNRGVNRSIRPRPDVGFDSWDIGVTEGDCEDFALQKRSDLIAMGWPSADLRIAITRTRLGEPHAVLLARVGGTDHVLDYLTDRIVRWDRSGLSFLMIQGRQDPRSWYDLSLE